ncbi:C-type lectin domain family 2 member D11-like isoform X2 [Sciurus carolinensis]|uniref:C-type lectin domain family 2 member D11-like isoform X2 n=1 Tax=Sciurus carolinensis TaxID=30640 RepID=UPI001FB26B72|nr:C-type lectin domain family 2 member D11-like isoform X2 [Sciurus carolinensis]
MTEAETSVEMLRTDLEFTGGLEKAGRGKTLQGNFPPVSSPVTPIRVYYWCFIIILVLITIVIALPIILSAKTTKPILENPVFATCPKDWIGFGSKCFYFSDDIGNWTFSQTFCASLEASLVQFESHEELNFLIRYKGLSDHWIGLNRESSHHVWKWTDKTEYKSSFSIKGDGECAYLNDNGISSARHYTDRKWICSRPNSYVHKCGIMSGSSK